MVSSKYEKIAEILGYMEESGKSKDWLIHEIKKKRFKVKVRPTMNSFEILKNCPEHVVASLFRNFKSDDFGRIEDIKTLTRSYHWFYTDIVGSANPTVLTKDQAKKVWALNNLVGRTETFKQWNQKLDVMSITGDGMVIGFADSPEKPLRLAIELHKIILRYNESRKSKDKLSIRIGIDTGPVYFIKDLTGKDNFWGPGIIMARRVMDLARSMQILASERISNSIRGLSPENKALIHSVGEYKIKHGEKLKIFNIYDSTIGNKLPPPQPSPKLGPEPSSKFVFPKVELKLDVVNPKTMMTHHTWLWKMVNVTGEPEEMVSYLLDGDVPRDLSDLNIIVRDGNNKKLKISNVNVNKPEHKEFVVKLNKPLKPNQQTMLKMEYDWEEPERNYFYRLATSCRKFKYSCKIPKVIEAKPRVLKVDPATGYKAFAPTQADVRYLKDGTEISWQASDLPIHDAYQFEW